MTVGIGAFLLLQSYMNIKQLTYIVRLAMLLTVLSMIYVNAEVYFRYFILSQHEDVYQTKIDGKNDQFMAKKDLNGVRDSGQGLP